MFILLVLFCFKAQSGRLLYRGRIVLQTPSGFGDLYLAGEIQGGKRLCGQLARAGEAGRQDEGIRAGQDGGFWAVGGQQGGLAARGIAVGLDAVGDDLELLGAWGLRLERARPSWKQWSWYGRGARLQGAAMAAGNEAASVLARAVIPAGITVPVWCARVTGQ